MVATETPAFLTTREVAELLGVDVGKVCDWIASGDLNAVNVAQVRGGIRPTWRISRSALEKFLNARQSQQPAPPPRKQKASGEQAYY